MRDIYHKLQLILSNAYRIFLIFYRIVAKSCLQFDCSFVFFTNATRRLQSILSIREVIFSNAAIRQRIQLHDRHFSNRLCICYVWVGGEIENNDAQSVGEEELAKFVEGSYLSEKSSYTIAVTRLDCEMVTFKKGEIESDDVGAKGWRMKDVAVKHYCCV